jgi:GDP-4-dehydro-6-deoxy-D-mannose reductase
LRILVTGAHGFVGRWLLRELTGHGHDVVAAPPSSGLDITDRAAVQRLVREVAPDAIAHLAAVSFAGDARRDAERAMRVNVGGTAAIFEAARGLSKRPKLLVTGSSEVYGTPRPEDLPLRETSPLRAAAPYGLSKLAQEGVAVDLALAYEIPLIVTRAFNHIGPGQRPEFVVPALAGRIADAVAGRADSIPIGNADVRRDFLDVRDVVRAYRLLLESAEGPSSQGGPVVVNVASGASVSIRWIADTMKRHAGCSAELAVLPELVRPDDAPDIVGSADLLTEMTGWRPTRAVDAALGEILVEAMARRARDQAAPA